MQDRDTAHLNIRVLAAFKVGECEYGGGTSCTSLCVSQIEDTYFNNERYGRTQKIACRDS